MRDRVYLDHSATTPLRPEVLAAMLPYFADLAGNPSSLHEDGQRAKQALDAARETVAGALGATPREIIFTGGGTEGDNLAILGVAEALQRRGRHIITSAIEHPAVLRTCEWLERRGFAVTYLPVDPDGVVDLAALRSSLRPDTVLVSIMLANNEIGSVQPLAEIAELAHRQGALVHTDAVQAMGKMPVRVDDLGVDLLTLTAHKFCGPKGCGALFVRKGTPLEPIAFGGHQERGLRPGTQNIPGIVGLATALELAIDELPSESLRLAALRDRLQTGVTGSIARVKVNGAAPTRLPNILNVSYAEVDGEALLMALDMRGISVSTGSACAAGASEPSHVLRALGLGAEWLQGAIRISLGRTTTDADIDATLAAVREDVTRLRSLAPQGGEACA